jgi:predicted AlkP superfamily phosphohydrolase/phosphomutase
MNTLLVGLDAACRPVLDRLSGTAELPAIDRLLTEGATGRLRSQIPPWTASAWPSLYTGTNPGKHGVFSFLDFAGYDWNVVDATHVRQPALWELLSGEGLSSVVVNVPATHPPREFDGALIPGYVAPEDPACHPEGLLDEVREAIGEYRVYPHHTGGRAASEAEKVAEYRATVRMRGDAFRYLAERFDPEFGFVQFQSTDTVFHECPDSLDAARAVYEAVDEQVGAILDACEPGTVVFASDHGIGEYGGYEFRANAFLRDAGFVRTKRGGAGGMPSWDTIRDDRFLNGNGSDGRTDEGHGDGGDGDGRSEAARPRTVRSGAFDSERALQRAMALAARAGATSQRLESVLERLGLAEFVVRHVPKGMIRAGTERVDFPASQAFARSRIECGVRLNVVGREPNGVVSPESYDAVREELIELFSTVETPDGTPVFEDVAPREAYFHGPEAERAVDIVTVPTDFDQFLSTQLRESAFGPPTEPWNHKREGVVAVAGAGIDAEASLAGAHLFDVAPTVLATVGLGRGTHMDGDVLAPVEPAGEREYPAVADRERTTTDDRAVEARLSELGYLE